MLQGGSNPEIAFEHWHEQVESAFCPMEVKASLQDASFDSELHQTALNHIQLARIGSSSVDVFRRKSHISRVSDAFYLVKFQLQGSGVVQQRGREAHLNPGDFVICSTSDPYELHFPDRYRQAVLAVPQPTLTELFSRTDDYLGLRMGNEEPTHSLLSSFVTNLVERIDLLDSSIVQRLEANVLDLLVTSLQATENRESVVATSAEPAVTLLAIKRLINLNLRNPNLTPDFIAQNIGISKRYLHMLFKKEGVSVSRYVQQQRLKGCRKVLASAHMAHLSMTDIAHEWGFSDVSHFHRCFKSVFHLTPREYRLQALQK